MAISTEREEFKSNVENGMSIIEAAELVDIEQVYADKDFEFALAVNHLNHYAAVVLELTGVE